MRLPRWLSRRRSDDDVAAEIDAHVAHLRDEQVERGMPPEEARYAALRAFGNVTRVRERFHESSPAFWLETLVQDVRLAWRSLARAPLITLTAVISLAIGIGLNTAIFSIVQAVLLRPLPYKDPDRLVGVAETLTSPAGEWGVAGLPPADYLDIERQNHVFESMAAIETMMEPTVLVEAGASHRLRCLRVSASYFAVIGVPAALGRVFGPDEDRPDAQVAVVSHDLWREQFNADPRAVGRQVTVNGTSLTVIGVMPPAFRDPSPMEPSRSIELWRPYAFATSPPENRNLYTTGAIARLKPGVTLEQARAEVDLIVRRIEASHPKAKADDQFWFVTGSGAGAWVEPLLDGLGSWARPRLMRAWAAMALVLLVAWANVAGLLLARAESRKREFAVRASLGARRGRLARQLLTESALLALAGGTAGLLLAYWGTAMLTRLLPSAELIQRIDEASIDLTVLAFTVAASLASGLVFGLAPAWRGSAVDLRGALTESARTVTESKTGLRVRNALVACQLALSLVLLAGAGLMINSLWRLSRQPLGFEPARVLTFQSALPQAPPYATDLGIGPVVRDVIYQHRWRLTDRTFSFPKRLAERLRAVPGVEHAAVTVYGLPLISAWGGHAFTVDGQPPGSEQQRANMRLLRITPDYFAAMQIPMLQGRDFRDTDDAGAARVVVISRYMAETLWPGTPSVIGRRITVDGSSREVIGVVGDVRLWPGREIASQLYVPLAQSVEAPDHEDPADLALVFNAVVRTGSDPGTFGRAAVAALQDVEPGAPVKGPRAYESVVTEALAPTRATLWLLSLNAAVALLLAAVGLYGVLAYSVVQRTHEIGVRMALGASQRAVVRLVLRRAFLVGLSGTAVGCVAAYWATQLIENQLYEVTASDPATFGVVVIFLLAVALLAAYLPARRAAAVDPIRALRCE